MKIYHLDLKVAMFRVDYLKRWFDRLRDIGFGGIVVEIDNKLRFPSHPEFAAEDALDAAEWNSLVKYARSIGLVIYPLIQTLGHMQHVLIPGTEFMRMAEMPGNRYLMCPSKDETYSFIKDLIDDVYDVFDHPEVIHLGGDECSGIGECPRCYGIPKSRLLTDYMLKLANHAIGLGVRPEFWADMVLAHPECLDELPKETRFVDWLYNRTGRYGSKVGICWGAFDLNEQSLSELREKLPDHLRFLLPYMTPGGDKYDNYYGAVFLRDKGYEVSLASGVRSGGDCYSLPRTDMSIRNVATTETVARELDCDHMVTSWAVRLSHPETTWPALLASGPGDIESPERVTACIGGVDIGLMNDITTVQLGTGVIDILREHMMRFERPYYEDLSKTFLDMVEEEEIPWATRRTRNEHIGYLTNRIDAAHRILPIFERNLQNGAGEESVLRHWILGIRMCLLKSEQTLAMMNQYINGFNPLVIKGFIDRNHALAEEFSELWRQSVTDESLDQELEVKFRRDIRVLEEML